MAIKFGTDGWRAIISKDFTYENLMKVSKAFALYLKDKDRSNLDMYHFETNNPSYKAEYKPYTDGVVIGYDNRFMSEDYALLVAKVLSFYNIPVYLSKTSASTPATSFGIKKYNASHAIMITASHNPYRYNGFKIKCEYAGSALPEVTKSVENYLKDIDISDINLDDTKAEIKYVDLSGDYLDEVFKFIDVDLLKSKGYKILIDYMHGSAAGYFSRVLSEGVVEYRANRDALFGFVNPEPIEKNIKDTLKYFKDNKFDVGFVFDGDGDRIGAIDENGNFLTPNDVFTLLVYYLVTIRGWYGGLAKTVSTTDRIKHLAKLFNLEFYQTPVGFKHISKLMLTKDILIGGEESGGIGVKNHIPERDSILNALFLLDFMAKKDMKLGELLDEVHSKIGFFTSVRVDVEIEDNNKKLSIMDNLKTAKLDKILDYKVIDVEKIDGVKFILEGKYWILARPSGTEPLIRVYCESDSKDKSYKIIKYLIDKFNIK